MGCESDLESSAQTSPLRAVCSVLRALCSWALHLAFSPRFLCLHAALPLSVFVILWLCVQSYASWSLLISVSERRLDGAGGSRNGTADAFEATVVASRS